MVRFRKSYDHRETDLKYWTKADHKNISTFLHQNDGVYFGVVSVAFDELNPEINRKHSHLSLKIPFCKWYFLWTFELNSRLNVYRKLEFNGFYEQFSLW